MLGIHSSQNHGGVIEMLITDLCVGCTRCVPYCPSGAISIGKDKKAHIDRN
ncbi:4Fe-4S binding protein, partial [Candidatus Bathyarchaeota archaeon]|nr:4Fe-4S binding protein [Candidatus Bathyarchaeota archaeon]